MVVAFGRITIPPVSEPICPFMVSVCPQEGQTMELPERVAPQDLQYITHPPNLICLHYTQFECVKTEHIQEKKPAKVNCTPKVRQYDKL